MLQIYLFLYVFSLSIPVFYHSAFLAGIISFIHLIHVKKINFFIVSRYTIKIFGLFILGYFFVILFAMLHQTFDLTYLRTYTNAFLSLLIGVPLSLLYQYKYKNNSTEMLVNDLFKIHLYQAAIIVLVILIPVFKPLVSSFHRAPEIAATADIFSNGLRTNALSGGLFFGLSLSFSISLILYIYFNTKRKVHLWKVVKFIFYNIGLLISGRFGGIYIFILLPLLVKRTNKWFKSALLMLLIIPFTLTFLYFNNSSVSNIYDNSFKPYVFEFIDFDKMELKSSHSTDRLEEMYESEIELKTLLFGDGLYSENGHYYKKVDIGYYRLLYFGGVVFLFYIMYFMSQIISPLHNKYKLLYWMIFFFYIVTSFKGETMITLVSVNSIVFLFCHNVMLNNKKTVERGERGNN